MRGLARNITASSGAALLCVLAGAAPSGAKTPGTTYCHREICHRVKTIVETSADVGRPSHILASYYDAPWRDPFNPSLITSSGELFQASGDDTAASPIYPDGTRLLVYAPGGGGAAVVRINNAGPYWSSRLLDVSRGVAEKLGFLGRGLAHVVTVVLASPSQAEARYEAGRNYTAVPGYLGHFSGLSQARAAWDSHPQAMALAAVPPSVDLPDGKPVSQRIVTIGGGAGRNASSSKSAGAERGAETKRRVVLKPVKLRRPHLIAALAKRKTRVADNARANAKP